MERKTRTDAGEIGQARHGCVGARPDERCGKEKEKAKKQGEQRSAEADKTRQAEKSTAAAVSRDTRDTFMSEHESGSTWKMILLLV